MKTTATNRKVRELLTQMREGRLQPRPEFQRRLVWSNKDKSSFLQTVLKDYPFPEIYVAAGEVDVESGEAQEMLVDGQQRVTTLYQYFTASPDLKLSTDIEPYQALDKIRKEAFLQYDVVVRDLGRVEIDLIKEVFTRINATRYALNAMEIHNARYEGEFKMFAEQLAQREFFEKHNVFSAGEIKRMQDTRFALVVAATLMSTYFNRDDDVEDFLNQYNDEFPLREKLERELDVVFEFIEAVNLDRDSRAWKQADLFTLIVELHRAILRERLPLSLKVLQTALPKFYAAIDKMAGLFVEEEEMVIPLHEMARYHFAAIQATNDRTSRTTRGEVVRKVLETAYVDDGGAMPLGQS